jgi:hypothetical protein
MARKVHDFYAAFRDRTAPWSRVSIRAVLEARGVMDAESVPKQILDARHGRT